MTQQFYAFASWNCLFREQQIPLRNIYLQIFSFFLSGTSQELSLGQTRIILINIISFTHLFKNVLLVRLYHKRTFSLTKKWESKIKYTKLGNEHAEDPKVTAVFQFEFPKGGSKRGAVVGWSEWGKKQRWSLHQGKDTVLLLALRVVCVCAFNVWPNLKVHL